MLLVEDDFVLKFNPYHDRLGRFASGPGQARLSRFQSVRAALQQAHDRHHDSAAGRVQLINPNSTDYQVGMPSDSPSAPGWWGQMTDREKIDYNRDRAKTQWRAMLNEDEINGVRAWRSGSASVGAGGEGLAQYKDRAFKTNFGHREIREHLADNRHSGTEVAKAAKAFESAVAIAPDHQGVVLRGMTFKDAASAESFVKHLEQRGGLRMGTHSSATNDRFAAARFAGASANEPSITPAGSVMLRVRAKTAADISAVGDSGEFILRKGTKYRHAGTRRSSGGGYVIDIEEIE